LTTIIREGKAMLKCYRVWFNDGTAVLVDARNEKDARIMARDLVDSDYGKIIKTERLTSDLLK